jgi:hypothetical protein
LGRRKLHPEYFYIDVRGASVPAASSIASSIYTFFSLPARFRLITSFLPVVVFWGIRGLTKEMHLQPSPPSSSRVLHACLRVLLSCWRGMTRRNAIYRSRFILPLPLFFFFLFFFGFFFCFIRPVPQGRTNGYELLPFFLHHEKLFAAFTWVRCLSILCFYKKWLLRPTWVPLQLHLVHIHNVIL